jgi:hypothetical protein
LPLVESVTSSSMYNSILTYVLPFSTKLYMTALKPSHLPSSGLFETSTFPRLLVYAGCVTSLVHAASPSPYSRALYALPRHSLFGGLCENTAARAHLTRSRSFRTLLSRRWVTFHSLETMPPSLSGPKTPAISRHQNSLQSRYFLDSWNSDRSRDHPCWRLSWAIWMPERCSGGRHLFSLCV